METLNRSLRIDNRRNRHRHMIRMGKTYEITSPNYCTRHCTTNHGFQRKLNNWAVRQFLENFWRRFLIGSATCTCGYRNPDLSWIPMRGEVYLHAENAQHIITITRNDTAYQSAQKDQYTSIETINRNKRPTWTIKLIQIITDLPI